MKTISNITYSVALSVLAGRLTHGQSGTAGYPDLDKPALSIAKPASP